MGIPEVKELWDNLTNKFENNLLKGNEEKIFKKTGQSFNKSKL
jgi:hypothetical protein